VATSANRKYGKRNFSKKGSRTFGPKVPKPRLLKLQSLIVQKKKFKYLSDELIQAFLHVLKRFDLESEVKRIEAGADLEPFTAKGTNLTYRPSLVHTARDGTVTVYIVGSPYALGLTDTGERMWSYHRMWARIFAEDKGFEVTTVVVSPLTKKPMYGFFGVPPAWEQANPQWNYRSAKLAVTSIREALKDATDAGHTKEELVKLRQNLRFYKDLMELNAKRMENTDD
jgi:hypothetical protein